MLETAFVMLEMKPKVECTIRMLSAFTSVLKSPLSAFCYCTRAKSWWWHFRLAATGYSSRMIFQSDGWIPPTRTPRSFFEPFGAIKTIKPERHGDWWHKDTPPLSPYKSAFYLEDATEKVASFTRLQRRIIYGFLPLKPDYLSFVFSIRPIETLLFRNAFNWACLARQSLLVYEISKQVSQVTTPLDLYILHSLRWDSDKECIVLRMCTSVGVTLFPETL